MIRITILLVLLAQTTVAQKLKKKDKVVFTNLQKHISFLADDKLEGRRTGTNGEKLAYEYISSEFTKAGLTAKGENNTYLQAFEVNEGKEVNKPTHLIIDGNDLQLDKDYFPFVFSPNKSVEAATAIALPERGTLHFWDLNEVLEENKNNPHFDVQDALKTKVSSATEKGATGLIVYNTSTINDDFKFEAKAKTETTAIPVVYVQKGIANKFFKDETQIPNDDIYISGYWKIGLIEDEHQAQKRLEK